MKKKILGMFVCLLLIAAVIPIVESSKDSKKISIVQSTALIFGEITNLQTDGEFITFEAVNIKVITFALFSFIPYKTGEYFEISNKYRGFIGVQYIFALTKGYNPNPPNIVCFADSFTNRLVIIAANAHIKWRNIEITLDKPGAIYQVFYANDTAIAPVNNTDLTGVAEVIAGEHIQLSI